jgi:hypothetical protein
MVILHTSFPYVLVILISVSVLVNSKWSDTGLYFSPEYFSFSFSFMIQRVLEENVILETIALYLEGLLLESRWVYRLFSNAYVFRPSLPGLISSWCLLKDCFTCVQLICMYICHCCFVEFFMSDIFPTFPNQVPKPRYSFCRRFRKSAKIDYELCHFYPSAWEYSVPIGRIVMRFDVWAVFDHVCRNSSFNEIWQ